MDTHFLERMRILVVNRASITIRLRDVQPVNTLLLREHIALGQRVRSIRVEALAEGRWVPVASGTTIGNRRILSFETVNTDQVRITIEAKSSIVISGIEAYRVPSRGEDGLP
jgi:alpha-L-fucosidase